MLGSNWMGQLHSDCRLTELIIPGTHHSGSYSIQSKIPFGRNIGVTQGMSVYEQLCSGARYLDLRVAPIEEDTSSFAIWHSFLRGANIEAILQEVKDFCHNHTDEIVIVELVPEFGRSFSDEQKKDCLKLCLSYLDALLVRCHPEDSSPDEQSEILQTPVREILSNDPGRVLLLVHHRFNNVLSSEATEGFHGRFLKGSRFLRNPWHNTNQREVLQQRNLHCLAEECDCHPNRRRLVCSQLVATPQAGTARHVLTLIGTGTRSLWPKTLARQLYTKSSNEDSFLEWFRQTLPNPQGTKARTVSWNICSMDFLELCPELVETMIRANQQ